MSERLTILRDGVPIAAGTLPEILKAAERGVLLPTDRVRQAEGSIGVRHIPELAPMVPTHRELNAIRMFKTCLWMALVLGGTLGAACLRAIIEKKLLGANLLMLSAMVVPLSIAGYYYRRESKRLTELRKSGVEPLALEPSSRDRALRALLSRTPWVTWSLLMIVAVMMLVSFVAPSDWIREAMFHDLQSWFAIRDVWQGWWICLVIAGTRPVENLFGRLRVIAFFALGATVAQLAEYPASLGAAPAGGAITLGGAVLALHLHRVRFVLGTKRSVVLAVSTIFALFLLCADEGKLAVCLAPLLLGATLGMVVKFSPEIQAILRGDSDAGR